MKGALLRGAASEQEKPLNGRGRGSAGGQPAEKSMDKAFCSLGSRERDREGGILGWNRAPLPPGMGMGTGENRRSSPASLRRLLCGENGRGAVKKKRENPYFPTCSFSQGFWKVLEAAGNENFSHRNSRWPWVRCGVMLIPPSHPRKFQNQGF